MKRFSLFLLLTSLLATSSYGQWKHDYFMDAKGSKTNNAYVIATYNATFSNSVTANASMVASVLVSGSTDNYTVTFKMSKNDLTPAVRLGVLKVSTPVGDKVQKFSAYKGVLSGKKASKFVGLIKQGSKLNVTAVDQQSNGGSSIYIFSIEPGNFMSELKKM